MTPDGALFVWPATFTGSDAVTTTTIATWITPGGPVTDIKGVPAVVTILSTTRFELNLSSVIPAYQAGIETFNLGLPETMATRPLAEQSYVITTNPLSIAPTPSGTESSGSPTSDKSTRSGETSGQPSATGSALTATGSNNFTATNTTTPPSSTEHGAPRDAVSTGVAVGIGLGAAVAGALLALVFAFFCLRRKKSSPRGYAMPIETGSNPSDDSAPVKAPASIAMVPLTRSHDGSDLMLPQPMPNSALAKLFSMLNTRIKDHAHNYFGEGSSAIGMAKQVTKYEHIDTVFDSDAPVSAKQAIDLLNGSGSRRIAGVRLLLAWAIISNIDPRSSPDQTLLPPEIVECLHSIRERATPDSGLLSKWRHLTGTLLKPLYGSHSTGIHWLPQHNAKRLYDVLDEILTPLASPSNNEERRINLEQIIKLGAEDGYIMFTQPTTWTFDWHDKHAITGKHLVVFPDLVQVEDDQGRPLDEVQSYKTKQTVEVA